MNRRLASLILVPVALVLALTACTTGGSGSGGTGSGSHSGSGSSGASGSGSAAHSSDTRCVTGTWDLDAQGAGDQMLTYLSSKGIPISSVAVTGPITLEVTGDGSMTYTTGATYIFQAELNGMPMVITQVQSGSSHGHWAWAGGSVLTMDFTGWVNAITFTTTVTVSGQVADIPFNVPNQGPGTTPLEVHCTAHSLTLKADASPITLAFSRE
jgi:hypothetical protein